MLKKVTMILYKLFFLTKMIGLIVILGRRKEQSTRAAKDSAYLIPTTLMSRKPSVMLSTYLAICLSTLLLMLSSSTSAKRSGIKRLLRFCCEALYWRCWSSPRWLLNRTVLHQDVVGSIPTHDWTWHESITFSNDKIS
jgi:hypothetical protein